MTKSIIKLMTCVIALFVMLTFAVFAYSNEPLSAGSEIINVIKLLEIANGDENGNMNYDKEVTRAEFVKMAINASTNKEAAANIKLNISLFPDVKNSYWGSGYISVAVNNGLVTGYIDGTFKPNNAVTLEEAVTIVLRLLGYNNSDLIGTYPAVQLQKYKDLNLDKGMSAQRGDKLTREECMILIYNVLSTKNKQGSVYCSTLGLHTNNEGKLDYSALLEDKLDGPIIVTDSNNLFFDSEFSENDNTLYVLNNSPSSKSSITENDVVYYSDVINSVYAYRKTATGILNNVNSNTVTISAKPYTIASAVAKDKLSLGGQFSEEKSFITLILGINDGVVDVVAGDISRIPENDDNSTHLSMIGETISKPIYISSLDEAVNWKNRIPFDVDSANVYFNGSKTADADILKNDVIYHSKAFNSIWIYRKTVSGAIETIQPVTSPSSVTVSGKTYQIVGSSAAYDLSIYGSYDVGDRITLILGINNECVAIADTSEISALVYGVVTATGEKEYIDKDGEPYSADYVTVTDTTATSYTYEFSNKHLSVGDAVKVAVSDKVSILKLSTDNIGKGVAVSLSDAIRNGRFTDDCEIIDVRGSDVIKILPSRISGATIDVEHFTYASPVLFYDFDTNENISKLILKDFTGDIDDYGVVTSSTDSRISYMTDRIERNLSTEGVGCSEGPAKLRVESGSIVSASSMQGCIEDISAVTQMFVYDKNDKEYALADNYKVFIKTETGFTYSNLSDVLNSNYKLTAYYDKLPKYGGRVRVIIAQRKV
ncbi:MAG: S-layer homology domain-containing protein [Clostridia bacterium]|nr:S-layer homology domain-containing protein [Clostridia bacterium]